MSKNLDRDDPLIKAVESAMDGKPIYPDHTVFISAEMDGAGETTLSTIKEGKPVLVFFKDGSEKLYTRTELLTDEENR